MTKTFKLAGGLLGTYALTACGAPPAPLPPPVPSIPHTKPPPIANAPLTATPAAPPPPCRAEPVREAHGDVTLEGGQWLVERPDTYDTRVWEMLPSGPRLRARIEPSELRFLPGDRVAVSRDADVVVVDLATGTLHVLEKTTLFAATRDYLFVGDRATGRRLRATDLSAAGAVAWDGAPDSMRGWEDAHALDGGNSLIVGDTLVSFAQGKVLRKDVPFGAVSPDGKHISACDAASKSIVEIDVATGAIGARFPVERPAEAAECSSADNTAYADDHTIFWFEAGADTKDAGRRLSVAAGDTKTGKVTRLHDPAWTWSIAFSSYPFMEGEKLCTTLASFHTSSRACDWTLSKGRVVRRPETAPGPSVSALGLSGAVLLARAVSPSGQRVAVLTYRKVGKGDAAKKSDLLLTFATTAGKRETSALLQAGEIAMNDEPEVQETGETLPPWASVVFFDEATAGVIAGSLAVQLSPGAFTQRGSPSWLVSASTGVASPLCATPGCHLVGRYVVSDGGHLRDPLTGKTFELTPGESEWTSVPRVEKGCP